MPKKLADVARDSPNARVRSGTYVEAGNITEEDGGRGRSILISLLLLLARPPHSIPHLDRKRQKERPRAVNNPSPPPPPLDCGLPFRSVLLSPLSLRLASLKWGNNEKEER